MQSSIKKPLYTWTISVVIAAIFLANIAQCNAVFPCDESANDVEAPNVTSSLVGSTAVTFHEDHMRAVIPPRSGRSMSTPCVTRNATTGVCPNWAAKWMQAQPSASRRVGSAPAPSKSSVAPRWPENTELRSLQFGVERFCCINTNILLFFQLKCSIWVDLKNVFRYIKVVWYISMW